MKLLNGLMSFCNVLCFVVFFVWWYLIWGQLFRLGLCKCRALIKFVMGLKCISLNIRGINKSVKRRNLFRWLHNGKYDLIFLQETYSDKTIENAEWGGDICYSHGSKHSRGVMILFRPTLKAKNISITNDKNGRLLIVRLTLQGEEFCFVNVCVPNNQNQQINFYNELTSKLRPYANENLKMGGDFNCPLENIDKIGGKDISSKKSVIQYITEMSDNLNLADIWRLHHPSDKRFT